MNAEMITGKLNSCLVIFGFSALILFNHAQATPGLDVTAVLIGTLQESTDSRANVANVKRSPNAQFDLNATWTTGRSIWFAEVKAGSKPKGSGVTRTFPSANAAIGETTTSAGRGRIAVVQLNYGYVFEVGTLTLGLLDSTDLFDTSSISNDEFTQFLGSSFDNNLTIQFPSDALALTFQHEIDTTTGYALVLSSNEGIEDGTHTYDNVLHPFEDGKGIFTAGEFNWQSGETSGNLGIWLNTNQSNLEGTANDKKNFGIYTNLNGKAGRADWNVRIGAANPDVSQASGFIAAALAYPWRKAP